MDHGHNDGELLHGVLLDPDRAAGNLGEEGASVAVALRTRPCAPPPRPCPSSVLLRSGACTRTGPSRHSAARASSPPPASDNAATVRLWAEPTSLSKMRERGERVGREGYVLDFSVFSTFLRSIQKLILTFECFLQFCIVFVCLI